MKDQLKNEQEKLQKIVSVSKSACKEKINFLVKFQEMEISKIQSIITNIKEGNFSEESEELAKLLTENSKLKIRLEVLNRVSLLFQEKDEDLISFSQYCRRLQRNANNAASNCQPQA